MRGVCFPALLCCHPARDTSLEAEGFQQAAPFSAFQWVFMEGKEQFSSFLHISGSFFFEWTDNVQKAKKKVCILANEDAVLDIFSWAKTERGWENGAWLKLSWKKRQLENQMALELFYELSLLLAGRLWANHLPSWKICIHSTSLSGVLQRLGMMWSVVTNSPYDNNNAFIKCLLSLGPQCLWM